MKINKTKSILEALLIAIKNNPSRIPAHIGKYNLIFEKRGLVKYTRNKKGELVLRATTKLKQLCK